MAIRKIVQLGDSVLRSVSKPQDKFGIRLAMLLKDMAETMYDAGGVGLAGPQVGIRRRVAVVDVSEEKNSLLELVNPEIIERTGSQTGREGCLSLPGRQAVVTRPDHVRVRAQDRHGNFFEKDADGFEARAICHEVDHLDGVLYIDIMDRELTEEEIKGHIPEDGEECESS